MFEILYLCGWSVSQMMDGHWQWKVISSEVATMNAELALDMARYKVQKGPMCQTCVPVPLCRKIFGGKAHRLHVFFVAYDFV